MLISNSFSAGGSSRSLYIGVVLALILDLPFFIMIFYLNSGSTVLSLLVVLIPFSITALLITFSYMASKMSYVLQENGLKINFSASPLQVPYEAIRSAEKIETSLSLRFFGGSWPGSYWGIFATKNYGRVRAYSTQYKGTFILIDLSDGSKILLSPKEPDVMLKEIKTRISLSPKFESMPKIIGVSRRFIVGQVTIVPLVWIIIATYFNIIYPVLPAVIPVHWGLNGVPNRYGGKVEALWLLGVSAFFPILNAITSFKFGRYYKGLMIILGGAFIFALAIFGVIFWMIVSSV